MNINSLQALGLINCHLNTALRELNTKKVNQMPYLMSLLFVSHAIPPAFVHFTLMECRPKVTQCVCTTCPSRRRAGQSPWSTSSASAAPSCSGSPGRALVTVWISSSICSSDRRSSLSSTIWGVRKESEREATGAPRGQEVEDTLQAYPGTYF